MACKEWKPEWVARLYGELEPSEERDLVVHLERCATCPQTLSDLGASREFLQRYGPAVPEAPRVMVLGSRRAGRPWAAFAMGAACSAFVFVMGVMSATWLTDPGARGPTNELVQAPAEHGSESFEVARSLQRSVETFEQRLSRIERDQDAPPRSPSEGLRASSAWRQELERLQRRIERDRERDLDLVMDAIAATEIRTGTWIGQTREALQYLAVKQDPRFSEQ